MTGTYVSATQFTVVGDQTAIFLANRKVKCDCGVDGFRYGAISTSAFGATTTVTLTADSDDLTANLTDVEWSVLEPKSISLHDHSTEEDGGSVAGEQLIRDILVWG